MGNMREHWGTSIPGCNRGYRKSGKWEYSKGYRSICRYGYSNKYRVRLDTIVINSETTHSIANSARILAENWNKQLIQADGKTKWRN